MATGTQRLQVASVVSAAVLYWHDVIDLSGNHIEPLAFMDRTQRVLEQLAATDGAPRANVVGLG